MELFLLLPHSFEKLLYSSSPQVFKVRDLLMSLSEIYETKGDIKQYYLPVFSLSNPFSLIYFPTLTLHQFISEQI